PAVDWCGLFAVWCAKMATGGGGWVGNGPSFPRTPGSAGIQPGDIINVADDPAGRPKNHMCVMIRANGGSFTCVSGNGLAQQIVVHDVPAGKVAGYWKTVPDAAPTGTPTSLATDPDAGGADGGMEL